MASSRAREKDTRLPVALVMLQQLLKVLPAACLSHCEVLLFKAVFLFAFCGEFRIGELVANSRFNMSGHCFGIHDVCWVEEGLMVKIQIPKTDRVRTGQEMKLYFAHSPPFPCLALQEYLAVHEPDHCALFVHGNSMPLTRFQLTTLFRRAVAAISAPPDHFAGPSFCIGAASAPFCTICTICCWHSVAFQDSIHQFHMQ